MIIRVHRRIKLVFNSPKCEGRPKKMLVVIFRVLFISDLKVGIIVRYLKYFHS